ncbi:Glucose/arabinose dehydrogenase, beta-propeller fold [Flavobacteriaceae bacterium MAR_2010_188]|nr:Glucose/arabinose dehydrogenase, beta-propeller fold [Flavobacteriaceae bacterium MAR_2010_188]
MHRIILLFIFPLLILNCQGEKKQESDTKKEIVIKKPEKVMKTLKPDQNNGGLTFPDGFGALVVTESAGPSRHLAVNDNGDIYVKLKIDTGTNGNVALRDTDNDGKADIIERFGDSPNDGSFATEMRIHKGYLYYSSELVVYRQKLIEGELIPTSKPEVLMVDRYPLRWHNAKTLAFDNEDNMYVTFSAPTNACEDLRLTSGEPDAIVKGEYPCSQLDILGGVWKFSDSKLNQSQQDVERYATGLRSIVAMSWNQEDNSLYAVNHGRDYLHNHAPRYFSEWEDAVLPAEEFMNIKQGEDYGWPYTYYDPFKNKRMLAPEYGGDGKKVETKYADPILGLPAHWAPNDMLFYKGNQFPERYKKGAFIAFHGSTNRTPYPQGGYVVAFVPFKDGKPYGEYEIFADGFAGVDIIETKEDAKYRPMGLAEGPDGSLYISESNQGKIWRVLFTGNKDEFGAENLSKMEESKTKSYLKIPVENKDKLVSETKNQ